MNSILTGAVGGLAAGILIPSLNYFGQRLLNNWFLKIDIDENDLLNLRVYSSISSLTNAIAYITVNNNKNDIVQSIRIKESFCIGKVHDDRLSWSKNDDDSNFSEININPGEHQKLNLIRVHEEEGRTFIEIASEQGFFPTAKKPRIILASNRDYKFDIKITASNLFSKTKTFIYRYSTKTLVKS